jgi:hypothetical protein
MFLETFSLESWIFVPFCSIPVPGVKYDSVTSISKVAVSNSSCLLYLGCAGPDTDAITFVFPCVKTADPLNNV